MQPGGIVCPRGAVQAGGLTEQVVVEFQEKFPLRMSWNSNDGGASWTYFLAPRVTNDP